MSRTRAFPFKCSAVISDVYGTLFTDEKVLTSRAQAAAADLRANGIVFPITSARPPRGLHILLGPLDRDVRTGMADCVPVARSNASPEVQRAADLMTDSNEEEGFVNATERFILGDDRSDARGGMARSGIRA